MQPLAAGQFRRAERASRPHVLAAQRAGEDGDILQIVIVERQIVPGENPLRRTKTSPGLLMAISSVAGSSSQCRIGLSRWRSCGAASLAMRAPVRRRL